jgi:hypothetical protein
MRVLVSLLTLGLVAVAACGDRKPESPNQNDSTVAVPLPMQGARTPGYDPANKENFEQVVFKEYSHLAVQLPRRVMDSIVKSTKNPAQIEQQMMIRMQRQDSTARTSLAAKYGISRDSVDAILKRLNKLAR